MYVTAHRVHTRLHEEGINAYYYVHGFRDWLVPPDPEHDPGELADELLTVDAVGGNHVRSFLDVIVPDEMSWSDVEAGLLQFIEVHRSRPFPWGGVVGLCRFRVGMERALAREWRRELDLLYRACVLVLPA
jgi:hypothetical protein